MREQILDMALDRPELSPRELAVTFTDERAYFGIPTPKATLCGGLDTALVGDR
jgi:hypothetical protein